MNAKEYLSDKGYGTGSNLTISQCAYLMEDYASQKSAEDNKKTVDIISRFIKGLDDNLYFVDETDKGHNSIGSTKPYEIISEMRKLLIKPQHHEGE